MKKNPKNGYSLLELVISIGCIGIFAYIASPAMSRSMPKSYTEREAKKISSWFELLALKAAFREKDIIAELHEGDLVAFETDGKRKVLSRRNIPANLKVASERKILSFYRTGVCTPATIRITGSEMFCTIRLSLRGRASLECQSL